MRILHDLWFRIRALFARNRMDRELSEEMEFHLEMETQELIRCGLHPAEARRQAILALGGVEQYREMAREARGTRAFEELIQDIRYGFRKIRKDLSFSLVVILTLAIGIGGVAAAFTLVNAIYLKPLPYPDEDRLVMIWEADPATGERRGPVQGDLLQWTRSATAFSGMAGFMSGYVGISGGALPERLYAGRVTPGFFALLGTSPGIGRDFTEEETRLGLNEVVILSHGLWQRRFGGDPEIVGKTVLLNGWPNTVIGVLPEHYKPPELREEWASPEIWQPMVMDPSGWRDERGYRVTVLARMNPLVTVSGARDEIAARASPLGEEGSEGDGRFEIQVVPLRDEQLKKARPVALVLLAVGTLVLITVCVNLSTLFLARAQTRAGELGLRAAIGATKGRLLRQLFAEGVILSALGGGLGLLLVILSTEAVQTLRPPFLPSIAEIGADLRVILFTLGISIGVATLFGTIPHLPLAGSRLSGSLVHQALPPSAGRRGGGSRTVLVGVQVGLTVALLFGAILLSRSLLSLMSVQPGFNAEDMLAFEATIHRSHYPEPEDRLGFFADVVTRLESLPGVEGVSAVGDMPFGRWDMDWSVLPEGSPLGLREPLTVEYRSVDSDYFTLLEIPLLAGRGFDATDGLEAPRTVVLNQMMADWFWPGENAVGKRIDLSPGSEPELASVIGVVANDLDEGLGGDPEPRIYMAFEQRAGMVGAVILKSSVEPYSLVPAVRRTVADVDPQVPIAHVTTLEDLVSGSIRTPRVATLVSTGFALLALLLAGIAVHGAMACNVRSRAREIGIRTALGASPGQAAKEILHRTLLITLAGAAGGMVLALALGKGLASLLFQVAAWDPASLLMSMGVVFAVALLSASVPATNASRVDPMTALRSD